MTKIEIAVLIEAGLLSLYVLLHVLASRYLQPARRWDCMKKIFFPVFLLAMYLGYSVHSKNFLLEPGAGGVIVALVLIWLIHVGYLTVYAVFDRSITLRTFIELNEAGKDLSFDEIEKLYDPEAAFRRRIEILVDSGFMRLESGRYVLLDKGRRTGRLIAFLKNLYRTGEGG